VPKILSIAWSAKQRGIDIPLVTRHTLQRANTEFLQARIFSDVHVLLVEDNQVNQMVATEILNSFGCSVTPAGNGIEALELVSQISFDVIFMDCLMPEMDGFEATERLRQREARTGAPRMPIVAFTANAMKGDKEKCFAAGMDSYISKPVNEEDIKRVMIEWLPHKLLGDMPVKNIESTASITEVVEKEAEEVAYFDSVPFEKLKTLFGDKISDIIDQGKESAKANLVKVHEAIENNDAEALEIATHSLKSASRQFGLLMVGDLAEALEAQARKSQFVDAKQGLQELEEVYAKSIAMLSKYMDSAD
jgi:CheY-like chemotaxis protein